MKAGCLVCGDEVDRGDHHPRCAKTLFGIDQMPSIDLDLAKIHTAALAMVGHTSMAGVQKKISLDLAKTSRTTLQVHVGRGRFILKPQTGTFPAVPENELLTMRIAERAGVEIPPCGLVRLADGSLAYLVARFDRKPDGRKRPQEDFCQLARMSPKEKYASSCERLVKIVRRYATEPIVEINRLYRLLVVGWWTGNGDMHLKNFSLLRSDEGVMRLSPGYDLLSTRLLIPGDTLALPVGGKKDGITRRTWLDFAASSGLNASAAKETLARIASMAPEAVDLVSRSFLPAEQQRTYRDLLAERAAVLLG